MIEGMIAGLVLTIVVFSVVWFINRKLKRLVIYPESDLDRKIEDIKRAQKR